MFDRHAPAFREIAARGVIKPADVERLRRDTLARGISTEETADALFALDRACVIQDVSWQELFVDSITDYVVAQAEPKGYVTVAKAAWLKDRATLDGRLDRLTGLEVLIRVIEAARWSPPSLAAFVLRQIETDIVTGKGPLRTAATTGRGRVGKAAVEYMRRVLTGINREDSGTITRAEAEVLLDIHDATIATDNCVEWAELFTKAMADLLMTASGYAGPDRASLLSPAPWLMDAKGFQDVLAPYKPRTFEDRALAHLEHHKVEIITAEPIDVIDPGWLARRLGSTPELAPASKALLSYLRNQPRTLHPALLPLLDRAA